MAFIQLKTRSVCYLLFLQIELDQILENSLAYITTYSGLNKHAGRQTVAHRHEFTRSLEYSSVTAGAFFRIGVNFARRSSRLFSPTPTKRFRISFRFRAYNSLRLFFNSASSKERSSSFALMSLNSALCSSSYRFSAGRDCHSSRFRVISKKRKRSAMSVR